MTATDEVAITTEAPTKRKRAKKTAAPEGAVKIHAARKRFLMHALSKDATRPNLTAACVVDLDLEGGRKGRWAVACDGHRIHAVQVDLAFPLGYLKPDELAKGLLVHHPDGEDTFGRYVRVEQVIPEWKHEFEVPTAIYRALGSAYDPRCRLVVDPSHVATPLLTVEFGGYEALVSKECVGLNPSYVREALEAAARELTHEERVARDGKPATWSTRPTLDPIECPFVRMRTVDPLTPVEFSPDGRAEPTWFAVIMPMRL